MNAKAKEATTPVKATGSIKKGWHQVLANWDGRDGIEVRWIKGKAGAQAHVTFTKVKDAKEEAQLVVSVNPMSGKVQQAWRNMKDGKYSDGVQIHNLTVHNVGIDTKTGKLVECEVDFDTTGDAPKEQKADTGYF